MRTEDNREEAKAALASGRVTGVEIAHDGADGGEGGGDAESGKKIRQGGGDAEQENLLMFRGFAHLEEIDQIAIRGDETLGRVDREREEADEKGDDGDTGETRANPENQDRRQHDDRRHLQNHEIRIKAGPDHRGE